MAARSAGMNMGNVSNGKKASRSRVLSDMAEKRVPMAARPRVPSKMGRIRLRECLCDLQIEKDDDDGQDECLEYEHGEGVAQHFAQKDRARIRRCEAQAHQAVVLCFDGIGSAEGPVVLQKQWRSRRCRGLLFL